MPTGLLIDDLPDDREIYERGARTATAPGNGELRRVCREALHGRRPGGPAEVL
ncbi:hypothetical protein BH24ACI5_BH24ACI5_01590 [soil metagenome]|jgi:hypothetical protein